MGYKEGITNERTSGPRNATAGPRDREHGQCASLRPDGRQLPGGPCPPGRLHGQTPAGRVQDRHRCDRPIERHVRYSSRGYRRRGYGSSDKLSRPGISAWRYPALGSIPKLHRPMVVSAAATAFRKFKAAWPGDVAFFGPSVSRLVRLPNTCQRCLSESCGAQSQRHIHGHRSCREHCRAVQDDRAGRFGQPHRSRARRAAVSEVPHHRPHRQNQIVGVTQCETCLAPTSPSCNERCIVWVPGAVSVSSPFRTVVPPLTELVGNILRVPRDTAAGKATTLIPVKSVAAGLLGTA
jgi:hypothetical protein